MLEFYHKLQQKSKTFPSLKNARHLQEKATDNAVKDYRKQLQACVSANDGHSEHLM